MITQQRGGNVRSGLHNLKASQQVALRIRVRFALLKDNAVRD